MSQFWIGLSRISSFLIFNTKAIALGFIGLAAAIGLSGMEISLLSTSPACCPWQRRPMRCRIFPDQTGSRASQTRSSGFQINRMIKSAASTVSPMTKRKGSAREVAAHEQQAVDAPLLFCLRRDCSSSPLKQEVDQQASQNKLGDADYCTVLWIPFTVPTHPWIKVPKTRSKIQTHTHADGARGDVMLIPTICTACQMFLTAKLRMRSGVQEVPCVPVYHARWSSMCAASTS